MRLASLPLIALGVAAGYAAARQLLAEDGIPEQVPQQARTHLEGHRARLLVWRTRAREALIEARSARAEASTELMHRYHEATDRTA